MAVSRRVGWGGVAVLALLGLGAAHSVRAQVLARRNWEGSGVTVQAWWARGVFCAGGGDVRQVTGEMDALERMGCDAVEVDLGGGNSSAVIGDMDGLIEAAGRRKMRVVVNLDGTAGEQSLRERVGFWETRGVAGFSVRGVEGGVVGRLRQGAAGRLWIGEGGQLRVVQAPEWDAAAVRAGLAGRLGTGVLLDGGPGSLGYARAAMLLLSEAAVRIGVDAVLAPSASVAGEEVREVSPEEMLLWVPKLKAAQDGMDDWVRRLSGLHHQNAALRTGSAVFLDLDAAGVVGWVVAGRDGRGAVLVVCNLSGKEVRVPVTEAVRSGGVKGTYLRTVLRSDGPAGSGDTLEGIGLGVGGVFVGEVR